MRNWKSAVAGISCLIAAGQARAGWEIEQNNFSLRANGEPVAQRSSVLRVSKGRVRVNDEPATIVIDYGADRLTMWLPAKKLYWNGASDDYLREVARTDRRARRAPGTPAANSGERIEVKVAKTGEQATIAGRAAAKYLVTAGGKPFQEVWVASDFNLSGDLDVERLQAFQEKIGQSVRGKKGAAYAAVARSADYAKLYKTGFPVKTVSRLGNATIGREVVRVARADVAESEFSVPEGFTRVSLDAFMEAQDALAR